LASTPFALLHPEDDNDRLRRLGVTTEEVRKAVERGIVERMNCTMFDPPSYPGVVQWARTVRDLRETLVPKGWRADNTRNFSTVVSPNELVAIAVSTGDERTGREGEPEPRTKYPKGTVFLAAVNRNVQLSLFGEMIIDADGNVLSKTRTWTLLMRTDAFTKEVRVELSLPAQIGDDGRVIAWSERIIFTPLSFDNTLPGDDDPPIEGIDVPVEPI
jgi:hypothetical protein